MKNNAINPDFSGISYETIPADDIAARFDGDDDLTVYSRLDAEARHFRVFFQPFLIRPVVVDRHDTPVAYGPITLVMPPDGLPFSHDRDLSSYKFHHEKGDEGYLIAHTFTLRATIQRPFRLDSSYRLRFEASPFLHNVTPEGNFGLTSEDSARNSDIINTLKENFDAVCFTITPNLRVDVCVQREKITSYSAPDSAKCGVLLSLVLSPVLSSVLSPSTSPSFTEDTNSRQTHFLKSGSSFHTSSPLPITKTCPGKILFPRARDNDICREFTSPKLSAYQRYKDPESVRWLPP